MDCGVYSVELVGEVYSVELVGEVYSVELVVDNSVESGVDNEG
ncbi:hypothetical protein [Salinirubrum litoreum]|uniref:Uncharacterized protein n=1 Tax=Salinirubrum litoreum TaxID=1126234 RepID=A0ABD5R6V8_9EURY|nr:hypothetical protein [Salinirubrum litoreum]